MEQTWTKGTVYPYPGIGTIQFVAAGEHRYLVHRNPAPFSMGPVPPPQLRVVREGDTVAAPATPRAGGRPEVAPIGKRGREMICIGRRRRRFFWVAVEDLVQEGCQLLEPGCYFDTPERPSAAATGEIHGPFESMKAARLGAALTFQDEKTPRRRRKPTQPAPAQGYRPPVWGDFERRFGKGPPADRTCTIVGTIELGGRVHQVWGCSDPQPLRYAGKTHPGVYLFPSVHTRRHWPGAKASWYDAWYHGDSCIPGRRTFVVYQGGVTVREHRRRARERARARRQRPSTS